MSSTGGKLAERRELRRGANSDRFGEQRPRLVGEAPDGEHAGHAQRCSASRAQLGARLLGSKARIGDGCEVRRPVQHARLASTSHDHPARRQAPHGEPSRAVDDLDRGPAPSARLEPLRLGRERLAVEIEHGQHADAAVAAGARLDQQRALAVAAAADPRRWLPPPTRCAAPPPRACIIACMRSIMAARPDGILSASRSPWPSSTPSASACLCAEQVQDAGARSNPRRRD